MMLWLLLRGALHQPQLTMGHNIPHGLLPLQLGLPLLLPPPRLLVHLLHSLQLPSQSLLLHSGLPLLLPSDGGPPPLLHTGLPALLPWPLPLLHPPNPTLLPSGLTLLPLLLLLLHPWLLLLQQARGSL
jgi:hypothetical protein